MRVLLLVSVLAVALNAYDAAHLKKTIEEKECIGCDLRGANLSKMDFSGGDFHGSDLSKAD